MTIIEALESLEAAAQGNARLEALKKADEACRDLRSILFLALSPDVTFGVKKLPDVLNNNAGDSDEKWLHATHAILGKLMRRELTGGAAQEEIENYLAFQSDVQFKWATRILRQDLRLNLGAKDVNNTLGKNTIYLFEVPLATDYKKVKPKDLKGRWIRQPKLDGGRCVAVLPADPALPISLRSRTGKEWPNFESIKPALQKIREQFVIGGKEDAYLDGEVVSYVDGKIDFQAIQKTMLRKDGVEVGDLVFVVFDAANESEWKDPKKDYDTRLATALHVLAVTNDAHGIYDKVQPILWSHVEDPTMEDLKKYSDMCVEWGYEGGMYRRADLPVVNKRSKTLLKVKTFLDDEAEVIGANELMRDGKPAGELGALVCVRRLDGKATILGTEFEIGSGFSAQQRRDFWKQWTEEMELPKYVSFKYFELTDDGKPRFPIFRYFRAAADIGKKESDDE